MVFRVFLGLSSLFSASLNGRMDLGCILLRSLISNPDRVMSVDTA